MLVGMASWWEVAAILVGLVMVGLEIFVIPGFGVIGVVGLLLLFVGLVFSFTQSTTDVFRSGSQANAQLLTGLVTVLLAMFSAGLGIYFIARNFGSLPLFKHLVLQSPEDSGTTMLTAMDTSDAPVRLGEEGVAITPLRPSGRAEFDGQIIDVVAEMGYIEPGSSIRVVEVSGMRIAVALIQRPAGNERVS
jgi:membrane-bound serine protease (ClpP class)